MTPLLWLAVAALAVLLCLMSFVQMLYLESLRLRAREVAALVYFRETLQGRLGLEVEKGATIFSLVKHTTMVLLAPLLLAIAAGGDSVSWRLVAEAALISAAIMVISSYIVPQWLYRKTDGRWLRPLAPLLRLLILVVRPVAAFFEFLQSLAALNEPPEQADENGSASEDLDALIEAGAGEGLIEEEDRKLIHGVVSLGDKTVREVMTPRPNMVAIQHDASIEDLRQLSIDNHFSRFPVYGESIDDILGFVHLRDVLKLEDDDRATSKVADLIRPIRHVPETKPVSDLFREMQADNAHMTIVVDEYGETAGLATMEDCVEEVFGEIQDEHDPEAEVREESDGAFVISGNVDLDHLHDLFEFRPDTETESTTVGGLASEWLGHVPEVGESVERDGIRLEVTAADERHVVQVRASRVSTTGNNENGSRAG